MSHETIENAPPVAAETDDNGGVSHKKARPKQFLRIKADLGAGRTISMSGAGLNSLDTMVQWLKELLGRAQKYQSNGLELGTFLRVLKDEAKARSAGKPL